MAATDLRGGRERTLGVRGALALLALSAVWLVPALVLDGEGGGLAPVLAPDMAYAATDVPCGGARMAEEDRDRVVRGSFDKALEGDYVMVPFDVPAGTDAVRIKYCHDNPQLAQIPGTTTLNKHTLDMGVYGPRASADALWGEDEFRGWGGSSRKDVTLSPEGSFDPDPPPVATQETTIGYRPGPTPPGEWAVELGVAAIGTELLVEDQEVDWRVEIDLIDDPAFADDPYAPVAYDSRPASSAPGWYAGDLHVHGRHSAPGDATMRETFDYSFAPLGEGAGLDFITLSDYVTDRAWGEIGAFQADYPGKLIVRSSEIITYRGHINNHASGEFVDYRTGAIHEAQLSGTGAERQLSGTELVRDPRGAKPILEQIRSAGGWNQLNHVETFPSEVPTFGNLCRGCSWEYTDAETDYSKVDSIEVATGPAGLDQGPVSPGPNPFTPLAIRFYEDALDANGANRNRIAAVGVSDSHNAGTPDDPVTQSPIGTATTVVRAGELSEEGIQEGVEEGHTYVKVWGNDGPDLRFEAQAPGIEETAIMGDTLASGSATMTATVQGLDRARAARPGAYELFVVRDGSPFLAVPIPPGDSFEFSFPSLGEARYRLQVERSANGAASIEALSTPIWIDRRGDPEDPGSPDPPDPPDQPERCEPPALELTNGDDAFAGTDGRDFVRALRGADRLRGEAGRDCLIGNRGRDRIVGGPGRDRMQGARGRDFIKAADRRPDIVRCGRGRRDVAVVDRIDAVSSCERVRIRRRGGGRDSR